MDRREFLSKTKSIAAGATLSTAGLFDFAMPAEAFDTGGGIGIEEGLDIVARGKARNIVPVIRREILDNPRAVFIIETHVDAERDSRGFYTEARPQLTAEGSRAARLIFARGEQKGGSNVISPNCTTVPDNALSHVCGIITSPDFIAGFTEALRDMGNTNVIALERGGGIVSRRKTGVYDVFDRHNIDLIEARYREFPHYKKNELNWHKVPGEPRVMKNVPTCRPVGDPDNFFINMPKLKCHNLGLTTLSIKNLQGAVPQGYGHYCDRWPVLEHNIDERYGGNFKRDFVRDYYQIIEREFLRHRAEGYKYWDYEQAYPLYEKKGGWETFRKIKGDPRKIAEFMNGISSNLMWDEMWCQRALDSATALKPGINIIEGVIGRDGNGFGDGADFLVNYIVTGLSMPEVDAVASHIMGQNPLELYYMRIARERGLGENNPEKIAIYRIDEQGVAPIKLSSLRRVPMGVNLHSSKDRPRLFW